MFTKYIFTKEDLAEEYLDSLNFDPLYWLKKDKKTFTMEDLFKLAQPCEDKKSDRSIRYSDDDVCFELLFECLGDGNRIVGNADEHRDWFCFYLDKSTGENIYYLLTAMADL